MSTAVLSVTGVAAAGTTSHTFSTDPAADVDHSAATEVVIDGVCPIAWVLDGAAGGDGADADGPTAVASRRRQA